MPDKKSQDWVADEQFWADAWVDMEQQLDTHLPERKRRLALWYWILGGFMLVGVVLGGALPYYFDEKPPENKHTIQQEVIATTEDTAPPTAVDATDSITSSNVEPQEGESPAESRVANNDAGAPAINEQIDQPSTEKVIPGSAMTQVVVATDSNEDTQLPPSAEIAGGETIVPIDRDVLVAQAVPQLAFFVSESAPVIPLPSAAPFSPTNSPPKWITSVLPFGAFVEVGATQSITPGNGVYGSVGLQRQLGQKRQLSFDLSYRYQQEKISPSKARSSQEDAATIPDTTSESMDQFANLLSSNAEPYVTSQYLRLGINYQQQLGRKWTIAGGLGVNYALSVGLKPTNLANSNFSNPGSSFRAANVSNLFVTTNSVLAASGSSVTNLRDELDLRRWRYDARVSVGYQLNNRWSVQAGTTTYLSPIFGNTYSTTSWRGDLGIRYRF